MIEFISKYWEAIVAVLALITSVGGLLVAFKTSRDQQIHNIKMIKPILHVDQWDYENNLKVDLRNNGIGPAVVNKLYVKHKNGKVKNALYYFLPDRLPGNMNYKEYWTGYENFVVKPDTICDLIVIPVDIKSEKQIKEREKLRKKIGKLTVVIEYSDINGNRMPKYERELWVFQRTDNVN